MPLAAALVALTSFILFSDLRLGARWNGGRSLSVGVSLGALRARASPSPDKIAALISGARGGPEDAAPAALRALSYILRNIKADNLRLMVRFASDDAARDALLCGLLRSACEAARARGLPLTGRVGAAFDGSGTRATIVGIWSIKTGHIIIAAMIGAAEYAARRFKKWRNTRSKA